MIAPSARVVLHEPTSPELTGRADDMAVQAAEIRRQRDLMIKLLADHSGQPADRVKPTYAARPCSRRRRPSRTGSPTTSWPPATVAPKRRPAEVADDVEPMPALTGAEADVINAYLATVDYLGRANPTSGSQTYRAMVAAQGWPPTPPPSGTRSPSCGNAARRRSTRRCSPGRSGSSTGSGGSTGSGSTYERVCPDAIRDAKCPEIGPRRAYVAYPWLLCLRSANRAHSAHTPPPRLSAGRSRLHAGP